MAFVKIFLDHVKSRAPLAREGAPPYEKGCWPGPPLALGSAENFCVDVVTVIVTTFQAIGERLVWSHIEHSLLIHPQCFRCVVVQILNLFMEHYRAEIKRISLDVARYWKHTCECYLVFQPSGVLFE